MGGDLSSSSQAQLTKVARGGAINLVGAVVSSIGGFVLVVIVTNRVDSGVAGALFSATSVFLILTSVGSLGTETGLARFMLRLEARGRYHDIPRVVMWAAIPVATVSTAAAVAFLVASGTIAPKIGLQGPDGAAMLRVAVIAVPVAAASNFCLALTRAFGRMRPTATIDSIGRVSLQVILLLIVTRLSGSGVHMTAAWVGAYAPTALLSAYLATRIFRARRATWPEDRSEPADDSEIRSEFWGYTWARGLAAVCQIAIQRIDIVIIAALIGASKAAVYTAATRFVVLGQFTVNAIQQVLQPRFSQLLATNDQNAVRDVFKVSTSWSMSLAWPIYLTTACSAPLYLSIFGRGYESAGVPVVVIMALSMMFAIAAGPLDTLLLMAGGSVASLANTVTALVLNVGGCFVLIPRYGIYGAALAWGIAIVVRNLLTFIQVYGQLKLTPWSPAAAHVAVASSVCFAVPLLFLQRFDRLSVTTLLPVLAASSIAYAGALWLARGPLALSALGSLLRRRVTG